MPPKHSFDEIDPWTLISQGVLLEGNNHSLPSNHQSTLHIDIAITSTTAHTGTEIIVQTSTDIDAADANWSTLRRFIGPTGTAVTDGVAGVEEVGSTAIVMDTDVGTSDLNNDKKFKFMANGETVDNSEIIYQTSSSGTTITILDGATNEQDDGSAIYDIDNATDEVVGQYTTAVPKSARLVRVIYNNNYHADGSEVHARARISQVTDQ